MSDPRAPDRPESLNFFYRLVIVSGALFVLTILGLVATMFGDPHSPVNRFLNQYGGLLIGVEVALTLLLTLLALAVDRRQTLHDARREGQSDRRREPPASGGEKE